MIKFSKYKKIYFSLSLFLIACSIFGLLSWGLKLGIDFKGGTLLEFRTKSDFSTEELSNKLKEQGVDSASILITGENSYIVKTLPLAEDEKVNITRTISGLVGDSYEELRFETVGPAIGWELINKTLYAILISSIGILLWVAYQFKSLKFGLSAVLAMFHDSFILLGSFSFFGHFLSVEIDFLFVTALLTILSFSVHDTIVVFDRIREIYRKEGGTLSNISDRALTETMVRSLNNSFTIIFMLLALVLLGGSTVKWFALALMIGTIVGTYSSPFVAVPLLTIWDDLADKFRARKKQ